MLYLPKTTPSAGIRGIRTGNLFLPLSEEVPAVGQKGLYIQNAGRKLFLPLKEDNQLLAAGQPGVSIKTKNGRLFIPVMDESAIPDDPVFYLSCSQDTDIAETGQILSGNGTVSAATEDSIPCLAFADGAYFTVDDFTVDMSNPFTMALFVKFPEPAVKNHSYPCMGIGTSVSYMQAFFLNAWDSPYARYSCMGRNGGSDATNYNTDIHAGYQETVKWVHLAYIFDGTTATFYMDGIAYESSSTRLPIHANGSLCIGYQDFGYGDSYEISKHIAGVRIYDRALNASEVMALAKEFTRYLRR